MKNIFKFEWNRMIHSKTFLISAIAASLMIIADVVAWFLLYLQGIDVDTSIFYKWLGVNRGMNAGVYFFIGLSVNTVASFCKRQRGSESCPHCPQCGRSVVQTPHRKPKRFCSTQCHNTWWNHHAVSKNGKLQQLCPICKEPFFAYPSSHRKYCSRLCYGKYRKEMAHGKRTLP